MSSTPDSERRILWVVLPARSPFSASSPSTLVASWSGGSGACLPFFPLPFPWSLRYSEVNGWGAGMGLPYRVGPFFSYGVALPPR